VIYKTKNLQYRI